MEHDPVIVAEEPEEAEDEEDGGSAVPGGAKTARPPRSSGLATRADAVRMLQEVAAYLRKAEPSSPAPMFVDRAVKVLQMDFNTLIRELMPESKERIQMLGGISLDPDKP
jgi:type VI secretion system protein ImpA